MPSSPLRLKRDFDGLARQEVHFLDRQRDILRRRAVAQIGAGAEQAVDALGQHHDVGMNFAVVAIGDHADHLAVGVLHQFLDGGFAQHDRAGFTHLGGEPAIELGANDGVAVRPLLVEVVGAIMQPGVGLVVHDPEPLLDQMALQRRVFAEVRDQLFQHVGVKDRALHVLRARILAALDLQHLQSALGQRQRSRVAGHAGTDHDRVETFFNHG